MARTLEFCIVEFLTTKGKSYKPPRYLKIVLECEEESLENNCTYEKTWYIEHTRKGRVHGAHVFPSYIAAKNFMTFCVPEQKPYNIHPAICTFESLSEDVKQPNVTKD